MNFTGKKKSELMGHIREGLKDLFPSLRVVGDVSYPTEDISFKHGYDDNANVPCDLVIDFEFTHRDISRTEGVFGTFNKVLVTYDVPVYKIVCTTYNDTDHGDFIDTLYHELRHAWQKYYGLDMSEEDACDYAAFKTVKDSSEIDTMKQVKSASEQPIPASKEVKREYMKEDTAMLILNELKAGNITGRKGLINTETGWEEKDGSVKYFKSGTSWVAEEPETGIQYREDTLTEVRIKALEVMVSEHLSHNENGSDSDLMSIITPVLKSALKSKLESAFKFAFKSSLESELESSLESAINLTLKTIATRVDPMQLIHFNSAWCLALETTWESTLESEHGRPLESALRIAWQSALETTWELNIGNSPISTWGMELQSTLESAWESALNTRFN